MPSITLTVNGASKTIDAWDPDMPLLYALRNDLGLHAAKFGCGLAQCGACTVLIDDMPVRSCSIAHRRRGRAPRSSRPKGWAPPRSRTRCRPPSSPSRPRSAATAPTAW